MQKKKIISQMKMLKSANENSYKEADFLSKTDKAEEVIFNVVDPKAVGDNVRPISISLNNETAEGSDEKALQSILTISWNDTWQEIATITSSIESLDKDFTELKAKLEEIQKLVTAGTNDEAEKQTEKFLGDVKLISDRLSINASEVVDEDLKGYGKLILNADGTKAAVKVSQEYVDFLFKDIAKSAMTKLIFTSAAEAHRVGYEQGNADVFTFSFEQPTIGITTEKEGFLEVTQNGKPYGMFVCAYDKMSDIVKRLSFNIKAFGWTKDSWTGMLEKTAGPVIQNIFFDTVEEMSEYKEKEQKAQPKTEPIVNAPEVKEHKVEEPVEEVKPKELAPGVIEDNIPPSTPPEEGKQVSMSKNDNGVAKVSEEDVSEKVILKTYSVDEIASKWATNKMFAGKSIDQAKNFIENQIAKGVLVEMEHTKDREVAKQIATAHLIEVPNYYDRLAKLEDDAKKELGAVASKKVAHDSPSIADIEEKGTKIDEEKVGEHSEVTYEYEGEMYIIVDGEEIKEMVEEKEAAKAVQDQIPPFKVVQDDNGWGVQDSTGYVGGYYPTETKANEIAEGLNKTYSEKRASFKVDAKKEAKGKECPSCHEKELKVSEIPARTKLEWMVCQNCGHMEKTDKLRKEVGYSQEAEKVKQRFEQTKSASKKVADNAGYGFSTGAMQRMSQKLFKIDWDKLTITQRDEVYKELTLEYNKRKGSKKVALKPETLDKLDKVFSEGNVELEYDIEEDVYKPKTSEDGKLVNEYNGRNVIELVEIDPFLEFLSNKGKGLSTIGCKKKASEDVYQITVDKIDSKLADLVKQGLGKEEIENKLVEEFGKDWKETTHRFVEKDKKVAKAEKKAFIQHVPGHKNSSGEVAEWVIKDHVSKEILKSFKTEEAAKEGLKNMEIHKEEAIPFSELVDNDKSMRGEPGATTSPIENIHYRLNDNP